MFFYPYDLGGSKAGGNVHPATMNVIDLNYLSKDFYIHIYIYIYIGRARRGICIHIQGGWRIVWDVKLLYCQSIGGAGENCITP